jgi:hypothetical protein
MNVKFLHWRIGKIPTTGQEEQWDRKLLVLIDKNEESIRRVCVCPFLWLLGEILLVVCIGI